MDYQRLTMCIYIYIIYIWPCYDQQFANWKITILSICWTANHRARWASFHSHINHERVLELVRFLRVNACYLMIVNGLRFRCVNGWVATPLTLRQFNTCEWIMCIYIYITHLYVPGFRWLCLVGVGPGARPPRLCGWRFPYEISQ